jgi:hypothetical protein
MDPVNITCERCGWTGGAHEVHYCGPSLFSPPPHLKSGAVMEIGPRASDKGDGKVLAILDSKYRVDLPRDFIYLRRTANAILIILVAFFAYVVLHGCTKSIPISEIPPQAISYPCNTQSTSTTRAEYKGDNMPLVDLDDDGYAEGWKRITTKRVSFSAVIPMQIDPENLPKLWLCRKSKTLGMYCGGSRPYVETVMAEDVCERVKTVRVEGEQIRIFCGEYFVSADQRASAEVYAEVRMMAGGGT